MLQTARVLAFALLLAALPPAQASPQRIVSLGLCTDQLVLLLAERAQIASLSVWAADPDLSYLVDEVGDIPLNNASAERVIGFAPDLVIASEFVGGDAVRLLRRLGYDVRRLPVATSIDEIYRQLELVGDWTGNPERAAGIIATMRARLARVRARYADRPVRRVIRYAPNGYTVGSGTLEHDLFEHAGYRNLAAEMGITGFRSISLETLLAADPEVLQIDRRLSPEASLAGARLEHPALARLADRRETLDIPTPLRICAGPMVVDAVEMMAARR